MFERATKKLGLDQAIFMGGAFQSTGMDGKKEDGTRTGNYDSLDVLIIIHIIIYYYIFIIFHRTKRCPNKK